jgi:hypothetical protein
MNFSSIFHPFQFTGFTERIGGEYLQVGKQHQGRYYHENRGSYPGFLLRWLATSILIVSDALQ